MQAVCENGYLVFTTNHFSKYIVTVDAVGSGAADTNSSSDENNNVNTANFPSAGIAVLTALAACGAAVIKTKKNI